MIHQNHEEEKIQSPHIPCSRSAGSNEVTQANSQNQFPVHACLESLQADDPLESNTCHFIRTVTLTDVSGNNLDLRLLGFDALFAE